ncbi:MAG TPA: hypothetical protein VNM90_31140 [Haliangium sp.]|nr:hypothetical protein [Haliangium sp.]
MVLTSSGVFQTLALASEEQEDCADADDRGGCTDCSQSAVCACCPLRAVAMPAPVQLPDLLGAGTSVCFSLDQPVVAAACVDIFRPPRG